MIEVACPKCMSRFNAPDNAAGRTAKCPNCGSPIEIPSTPPAAAPPPAPPVQVGHTPPGAPVPSNPQGTTVVVQTQAPSAATIGPANKSALVVFLLWLFVPISGVHYFYLGQIGKGAVALLLDLFVFTPLIVLTCGMGLAVYIPWHIVLLIDGLVVTSRIRNQAISPWRCF